MRNMKFSDCMRLAKQNLFAYRRTTLLVMLGLMVSLVIIICSLAYNNSITNTMEKITNDKISCAYNEMSGVNPQIDGALLDTISDNPFVDSMQITYSCDLHEMISAQGDQYSFTLDNTILIVAGKEYSGTNDFTYDFPYESTLSISKDALSIPFEVDALVLSYSQMISDTELSEYSQKYSKGSPLIGNELSNDKEIIISEYMLSKYGFTSEQAEKLIGQKISIEIYDGKENKLLFDEYTLVGMLRSDFFRISSRKYSPHFIVPFSDTLFTVQGGQDVNAPGYTTIVNSSGYSEAIRANESLLHYGKSISLSPVAAIYADTEMQQILYNKIILLIAALLVFAVIVFVYSIVSYYFKMRNAYIGLERAVGMKSGQIFCIFLCEFLMMSTTSLALSLPLSFGLMAALRAFILQTLGYSMTVSLADLRSAALIGGIFVMIVSLLISYLEFLRSKRKSIIESLMDKL